LKEIIDNKELRKKIYIYQNKKALGKKQVNANNDENDPFLNIKLMVRMPRSP
jgi:hypothetical protein